MKDHFGVIFVRNHSRLNPISRNTTSFIPAVTINGIRVTCVDRPALQGVPSPGTPAFTLGKGHISVMFVRNHSRRKAVSRITTSFIQAVTRKDIRVTCVDGPVLQRVLSPYTPAFTLGKGHISVTYVDGPML